MAVNRDKRSQRKVSGLYRTLNRACRVNLIKVIKNILGVKKPLPVFRVQNEEKPQYKASEELIVTPYGTFTKYKQEELLDLYKSEQFGSSDDQKSIEEEKEQEPIHPINRIETPSAEEIQSTATLVDTKGVVSYAFLQVLNILSAIFGKTLWVIKLITSYIGKGLFALVDLFIKGGCIILSWIPRRVRGWFKNGEKALATKIALLIDHADHASGKVDDKLNILEEKLQIIKTKMRRGCHFVFYGILNGISRIFGFYKGTVVYIEKNKVKAAVASSGIMAILIASTLFIGSITAYEYSYNGKPLGLVKTQNDVFITVDVIGDKLTKEYNANIVIDKEKNISFKKVRGFDLRLDTREDVLNSFTYLKDMEVQASAIVVDGKQVAILDNSDSAKAILDKIQGKYIKQSDKTKYDMIGFAENVQIKPVTTKLGNLQDKETLLQYMLTGAVMQKTHAVKQGETFSAIANTYGISQSLLKSSNPNVVPDKLRIGEEIVLTAAVPVVTVQTTETTEYEDVMPFDITYENTDAKYKGEQSVKSKGISGKKLVVAQIVRNNGVEVSRNKLSETVVSEPVAQVVLVGTKKMPPLVGTGTFINPVRGKITSRFGTRWGRMHEGIDIGAPKGTDVKASDGGTVIFAGWDGAYGKCIRINHGGNRVTTYAHLSTILVSTGKKVFQGQHIGDVGSTGRSTGPHLHFEIRINNKLQNPTKYI